MYKILIADDEPWAAYGLCHLIPWQEYGFHICDTAANGIEALDKYSVLQPDVIISDIRMPGMDGLEMLEIIRQKDMRTLVVFISGYSDFHYAQRALRFGAFDYLVKQVTPDALKQLAVRLHCVLNELDQQKSSWDTWFTLLEERKLTISAWIMQNQKIDYEKYYIITFFTQAKCSHNVHSEHWTPDFMQIMLHTARNKTTVLAGYKGDNGRREWKQLINEYENVICGISKPGNGTNTFAELYRQADIAYYTAQIRGMQCPVHYTTAPQADNALLSCLSELDHTLSTSQNDHSRILIKKLYQLSRECLLDYIAFIYNSMSQIFIRNHIHAFDAESIETYNYRILAQEFETIEQIFDYFHTSMFVCTEINPGFSIDQVLQYIEEHYTQELRISRLAEEFHFTSSYFSTLFRRKTGKTLTKYIMEKRIHLAQQYLINTKMSIKEIADCTGYSDYFQFNKVFRRMTGMSPSAYRLQENGQFQDTGLEL